MARPTQSGLLSVICTCSCGWSYEGNNGVGLAAQHHDRCGGRVQCEITRVVIFG